MNLPIRLTIVQRRPPFKAKYPSTEISTFPLESSYRPGNLRNSSRDVLASLWQDDLLARLERRWVDANVQRHDLSNSGVVGVGQVVEEITRNDVVSTHNLALRRRAHGDIDDLADVDKIDIGDLGVGVDEGCEGDVEVGGNGGQSIARPNVVGGSEPLDAGLCGIGGLLEARVVVGGGAVGWDDEVLAGDDEVGVGDIVGGGDVADAGAVALGDGREGVAGDDRVVGGAGRAADGLAWGRLLVFF